jgi:cytochrome P450
MGALKNSKQCNDFMDAFEYAQRGTGVRSILGRLKFLHRDKRWWEACQQVTDYADKHVDLALSRLNDRKMKNEVRYRNEPLRLVDEMARDTQDKVTLRSHIISVFSPAHDGAAVTLTNAIFHLARNHRVWERLKAEIDPTRTKLLDYELLNTYQYLEWVLKESG